MTFNQLALLSIISIALPFANATTQNDLDKVPMNQNLVKAGDN